MKKVVAGQRYDSPLARDILSLVADDQVQKSEAPVACEADVRVTNAYIEFRDRAHNFKPYMVINGFVNSLHGDFGNDIYEISLNEDMQNMHPANAQECSFEYDPSDDELCDMIKKGFYYRMDEECRMKAPSILQNAQLQLPVNATVYHVTPLNAEDSPITIVDVTNRYNIPSNALSSGYASEDDYENGCIRGLLGNQYLDAVPRLESEMDITSEYDDVQEYDDNYIYANQPENVEVEELKEIEPTEFSDEDIALFEKYSKIQAAADKRFEEIERARQQAIDKVHEAEIESESDVSDEYETAETKYIDTQEMFDTEDESRSEVYAEAEPQEDAPSTYYRSVPDDLEAVNANLDAEGFETQNDTLGEFDD